MCDLHDGPKLRHLGRHIQLSFKKCLRSIWNKRSLPQARAEIATLLLL